MEEAGSAARCSISSERSVGQVHEVMSLGGLLGSHGIEGGDKMTTATSGQKGTQPENEAIEAGANASTKKLRKTRGKVDLISGTETWSCLVSQCGLTGEQMVQLQQALICAKVQGKPGTLVRIFAPTSCKERGVEVPDFVSLDEHPELILYEGYYSGSRRSFEGVMEKRTGIGPSLLEQRLQEGAITEVGITTEGVGAKKWLGRFGHFLLLGGWVIIIALIVRIVIAVSPLSK